MGQIQRSRPQRNRSLAARYLKLLLLGATIVVAACSSSSGVSDLPDEFQDGDERLLATVIYVVDGDTIDVSIGDQEERIRIIGIDTPEPVDGYRDAECYGVEASDYTTAMLPPGTRVRLTGDIEKRDRYGRLLAYIYREQDDLFVNLELIRTGYATDYAFEPNTTHADLFAKARVDAQELNLGLWGACGGPDRVLD